MIEELTEEQLIEAYEAEEQSEQSQQQLDDQIAVENGKKTQEQIDQDTQKLSEIPEKTIKDLQEAQTKLMKIINGYENPKDPNYDPSADINDITKMLSPIVDQLKSLPVPSIPGLQQIQDLLASLKSANQKKDQKPFDPNVKLPPRPDVPPDVLDTLQDLLVAIQSLCVALPLVMINLAFKMFDVVVKLFKQIAGVIGVPSIPFPLSLVGNCLSLVPDLLDFVVDAPGKISRSVKGIVMEQTQATIDKQIPAKPEEIKKPDTLVPSPKRQPSSSSQASQASSATVQSASSSTNSNDGSNSQSNANETNQESSQAQQQTATQTSQASSNSIVNIIEDGLETTDSFNSRY